VKDFGCRNPEAPQRQRLFPQPSSVGTMGALPATRGPDRPENLRDTYRTGHEVLSFCFSW
jgi:hypothetical protein